MEEGEDAPKYPEVDRKVSPTRADDSVGASLSCFLGCFHVSTFSADVRGSSSLDTTTRTCIVYAASNSRSYHRRACRTRACARRKIFGGNVCLRYLCESLTWE